MLFGEFPGFCPPEKVCHRLARHVLPSANVYGRWVRPAIAQGRNPVGVELFSAHLPRVARSSQPWALMRNPFGIPLGLKIRVKFTRQRYYRGGCEFDKRASPKTLIVGLYSRKT